jgi:hypothetical protein
VTDGRESTEMTRAFGAESRKRMLEDYFSQTEQVTAENAWKHVYRLLLWTDRTTGLAHCYESDKSQPGRPWYSRSLAFHDWISSALGTSPGNLANEIDWLFRRGSERLADQLAKDQADRARLAADQRDPYVGRGFPQPGEDSGLSALVRDELGSFLSESVPDEVMRRLTRRIQTYLAQENKSKNLVGEGFEDVLAAVLGRLPSASHLKFPTRPVLHSLRGFRPPPGAEKPRKVDLAVIGPNRRVLVSAKWSVRADREEQFGVDFEAYARLESAGQDFDFVLVTNEFDPARLTAACERRRPNSALFSSVVHVNPGGPLAAYGPEPKRSAKKVAEHVARGRLTSLELWLRDLTG